MKTDRLVGFAIAYSAAPTLSRRFGKSQSTTPSPVKVSVQYAFDMSSFSRHCKFTFIYNELRRSPQHAGAKPLVSC
jgi:hypothetical protein